MLSDDLRRREIRDWKATAAFAVTVLIYCFMAASAHADTTQVLDAISSTADRLCGYVAQSGSTSSTQVTGDVKAELNGLAKRLVDLGVSGTGVLSSTEYEGVLQQELTTALKNVRVCKIRVFDTLQKKLIPDAAPSTTLDPDAIYQLGAQVGHVQEVVIDLSSSTIRFGLVSGAMNLDESRDFRYRNYMLHIERYAAVGGQRTAPAPQGQWLERRFMQMTCRIVGTIP